MNSIGHQLRRLLTWRPDIDGRVIVICAVATYLGIVAAGRLEWGIDLWPYLGVPSGRSLFMDARNVTRGKANGLATIPCTRVRATRGTGR
jgi:hypothetical protein